MFGPGTRSGTRSFCDFGASVGSRGFLVSGSVCSHVHVLLDPVVVITWVLDMGMNMGVDMGRAMCVGARASAM